MELERWLRLRPGARGKPSRSGGFWQGGRSGILSRMKWPAAVVAIGGLALVVCGCGSAGQHPQRAPEGTPLQAALGWFAAVNAKDSQKAKTYFAVSARDMMDWGPASEWSTFANIHCTTSSATQTHALVRCTFDESSSPTEGNPDSWWSVELRRGQQGWLIDNYGQG